MNPFKTEGTMLQTAIAAAIIALAAFSLAITSTPIYAGALLAAWATYSAAVARITSDKFGTAFKKALFLDSLTYTPLLLLIPAKIAASRLEDFASLPIQLSLGMAIAANTAGKILLFPRNIDTRLDGKKTAVILAAAIIAYFAFFSTVSIMKHNSFNSTAFDMGIFDQTMWAYSEGHGPGFFNTIRGLVLLGDHAHPILFAYSALYKFLPMPESLLAFQSMALALGALPIYWMARKRLGKTTAAMIAASYLLYPSLQYINLFDFHPEAFATPLLLFAFHFADSKKYAHSAAMLLLMGLGKEHFPLALLSVGAYIAAWQKKRLIGLLFATTGVAWLAINFKVLLPHFSGSSYGYVSWYGYLGSSLGEIAKNAITHPQLIIMNVLAADKLAYATLLLFPAIVALLGLQYLALGLPFFAINFLRAENVSTAILYQYNAELIPFIYLAAIAGTAKLIWLLGKLKLNNAKIATGTFLLLATAAALAAYGPFATIYDLDDFAQNAHTKAGHQMLKEIPPDASVSADPYTTPHLTHRKEAYMFPNPFRNFMYGKNATQTAEWTEYVLLDLSRASPAYSKEMYEAFIAEFLNNKNYGLVKLNDSYALFRKGADYGKGLCDALNGQNKKTYLNACQKEQLP